MALTFDFIEGFDDYPDTGGDVGVGGTWNLLVATNLAAGRFGNRCLQIQSAIGYVQRPMSSVTKLAFGFAYKTSDIASAPVTGQPMGWLSSTNNATQWQWGFDDLGHVRCGPDLSNPLGISTRRLIVNTWHFLEWEFELGDANGRVKLWIDGELQFEHAGIDTKASADADVGRIAFTAAGNQAFPRPVYVDDLYMRSDSAVAIGESRAQLLVITGDDAVQWTKLGGATNASQIGEAQCDRDVTYNSSNNVGDQDTFTLANFVGNPTQIFALQLSIAAEKDDAGTRTVAPVLKTAGGTHVQADLFQTTQYLWGRKIFNVNPDTGLAWSKADFQGDTKIGYKLTA